MKQPAKVVFVDGVHYPVKGGEPDLSRPLRWRDNEWVPAGTNDPLHNDTHHSRGLELNVGGES